MYSFTSVRPCSINEHYTYVNNMLVCITALSLAERDCNTEW